MARLLRFLLEFWHKIRLGLTLKRIILSLISVAIISTLLLLFIIIGFKESLNFGFTLLGLKERPQLSQTELLEKQLYFLRIYAGDASEAPYQIAGSLSTSISRPPNSSPCSESGICGVPGLIAVAQSTDGARENIELLQQNPQDSILLPLDLAYFAYLGIKRFKDNQPMQSLRILSPLQPNILQIIVLKDSSIQSLRDLKGKHIAIGQAQSSTELISALLLKSVSIERDDYVSYNLNDGQALHRLENNEIDALFVFGPMPSRLIYEFSQSNPLRLLSIEPDSLARLRSLYPYLNLHETQSHGYGGVQASINTLAMELVWLVNDTMSNDLAKALTQALWSNRLDNTIPFLAQNQLHLPTAQSIKQIKIIPFHAGALQYFNQNDTM